MPDKKPVEFKFRKNCVDIVMILPGQEGSIAGEKGTVTRVSMDQVMDIDFMSGVFRTMWTALVKQDKQLSKIFEEHFRNFAIAQKRAEKLMKKEQKRALEEELKNASKAAKNVLEKSAVGNNQDYDKKESEEK